MSRRFASEEMGSTQSSDLLECELDVSAEPSPSFLKMLALSSLLFLGSSVATAFPSAAEIDLPGLRSIKRNNVPPTTSNYLSTTSR